MAYRVEAELNKLQGLKSNLEGLEQEELKKIVDSHIYVAELSFEKIAGENHGIDYTKVAHYFASTALKHSPSNIKALIVAAKIDQNDGYLRHAIAKAVKARTLAKDADWSDHKPVCYAHKISRVNTQQPE